MPSHLELIPVVDVFAGAGGLGEGFAAYPDRSIPAFRVALSIEKELAAVRTLRLRAFYHAFAPENVPGDYYSILRGQAVPDQINVYLDGNLPLSELLKDYQNVLPIEPVIVWQKELSDSPDLERELDERILAATCGRNDWVLVGGPPCQPFSTVGRSKHKSFKDYSLETDPRHKLYQEYLRIIVRHWPAVFVMENVPGILSAQVHGEKIFHRILEDLGDPEHAFRETHKPSTNRYTYNLWPLEASAARTPDIFGRNANPDDYLIKCEKHGIPQTRHRVILVGIRSDINIPPKALKVHPGIPSTVESVITGLPELRGGIARTSDSRAQWQRIVSSNTQSGEPIHLTPVEMNDVIDSDMQWLAILKSAERETWFHELEEASQHDVLDQIRKVLKSLKSPEYGRGREYIPGKSRWLGRQGESVLRNWIDDPRMNFVCNHATREHMPTDHHRYLFMAAFAAARGVSPRLREFPKSLLPQHQNVEKAMSHSNFSDRFRVQVATQPASTVLSHAAKDGHYFIHPDPKQARSLTVREAARLQTFPDNYCFFGNRSEQYTQIGNAVPPLLSFQIAEIVADVLTRWKGIVADQTLDHKQKPSFYTVTLKKEAAKA